jgi:hypothetical protein
VANNKNFVFLFRSEYKTKTTDNGKKIAVNALVKIDRA